MSVRVRFAPSPTGSPHVGNLRTAIFDWLAARKYGGQFVARLEDTDRDPTRYRAEGIAEIEESLRWLGITPDEWWVSGGPCAPYVQSERLGLYRDAASTLLERGMAYRCYCTEERLAEMRAVQQAKGSPTGYDRRCRFISDDERAECEAQGLAHTVRLAVPQEGTTQYSDLVYGAITFDNRNVDDQVLLKSNGWPTYHLAVVVDDHEMGITHVIRGEDWMASTPKQVLIYQALGLEQPVWVHIPLTLGPDRRKLSKRHGATQFMDFIRLGYLPEAMFNFLVLLGWSAGDEDREIMSVVEILDRFELTGIGRNPAVFDYDKLRWMNGEYIRKCAPDRLLRLCLPYLIEAGLAPETPTPDEIAYLGQVVELVAGRMRLLSEAPAHARPFLRDPDEPEAAGRAKWLSGEGARARLTACIEAFAGDDAPLTIERAEELTNSTAEKLGTSRAPVIHTLRVATTGG
ncbi:MAG: glutamate--tRNA ligase, partial [Armatimonadetes bacterium]|nr:glutamate--tRNA ligase [Armatimonadota bacterium]